MSTLFVDDDNRPITHPFGMRPGSGSSNITSVTMSASTQSLTLPTGGTNVHGQSIYRIIGIGQAVFYAIGASGGSASFTGATNMVFLAASTVEYFRADPIDTTIYVLQGGTAGTVQIALMT